METGVAKAASFLGDLIYNELSHVETSNGGNNKCSHSSEVAETVELGIMYNGGQITNILLLVKDFVISSSC